jgi:hypothetical protein
MVREADLEATEVPLGRLVPNSFTVSIHPDDLDLPPDALARALADAYESHAAEEGWRLPGPTLVDVRLDPSQSTGYVDLRMERRKGTRHPWGRLRGTPDLDLANNRLLVGRSVDCDVVVPHPEVSRRHALLTRRRGSVWVQDLASANGTRVNGVRVTDEPREAPPGSVIAFADHYYRLEIA